MDVKKKYVTIKKWTPHYKNPIRLKRGDKINAGKEDDEWKGWTWCTNSDNSGWVPKQIIDHDGVILEDYEAIELSADVEDSISEIKEVNGWIWGESEKTLYTGWLPKEILKEIKNSGSD